MLIVMLSRLHAALFDDHKDDEGVADDAEHEDDDVQEDDEAADPCLVNEVLKVSKWSLDYIEPKNKACTWLQNISCSAYHFCMPCMSPAEQEHTLFPTLI